MVSENTLKLIGLLSIGRNTLSHSNFQVYQKQDGEENQALSY